MSLTKKHFKAIAGIVRDAQDLDPPKSGITRVRIASDLANYFAGQNPLFDREKFMAACGFPEE